MTPFWDEVLKYVIITFFGAAITFFFTRQVRTHDERAAEREKRFTELITAMTDVNKTTADVGKMTAEQLMAKISYIDALDSRMRKQEEEIGLLKEARRERDKQIADLQVRVQADLMETEGLKNQINQLRQENTDIRSKYNKVVEFFVGYLKARDETIPPDLALLLGDSISKYKGVGK